MKKIKSIKNKILHLSDLIFKRDEDYFLKQYKSLLNQKKNKEAVVFLKRGLRLHPMNEEILNKLLCSALENKDWSLAINSIEMRYERQAHQAYKIPFDTLVQLSMLYQLIGNHDKAATIFQQAQRQCMKDEKIDSEGYEKLTVFDNGQSRIEFYKKRQKTDTIMFTFDSINIVWTDPPFAHRLFTQENVDIVAIRKSKKKAYQQDMSLNDFVNSVKHLVTGYEDRVAYGYSLGAYSALYYGSAINLRILAISPRLSAHPIYGKKSINTKFDFNHNLSINYNSNISPIIIYDPKNNMDHAYVTKGLLPYLPDSEIIEVPYGGHGMGPHLVEMGVLKKYVLEFLNKKQTPIYNKKLRKKSYIYFRVLANACYRKDKLNWAINLVEQALKLNPKDNLSARLKIRVLRKKQLYKNALEYAKTSIMTYPKDRVIRLLQIDLYTDLEDLLKANKEITRYVTDYGKSKAILKRKEKIQELNQGRSSIHE